MGADEFGASEPKSAEQAPVPSAIATKKQKPRGWLLSLIEGAALALLVIIPFLWGWLAWGLCQFLLMLDILFCLLLILRRIVLVARPGDRMRRFRGLVSFIVLFLLAAVVFSVWSPYRAGMQLQFMLAEDQLTKCAQVIQSDRRYGLEFASQDPETRDDFGFAILRVSPELAGVAYVIKGRTYPDGTVCIEFWTGGGFPVIHTGFAYVFGNERTAERALNSRWRSVARLKEHWYEFGLDRLGDPIPDFEIVNP